MEIKGTKVELGQLPKTELGGANEQSALKNLQTSGQDTLVAHNSSVSISHTSNILNTVTAELKAAEQPHDHQKIAKLKQAIADGTLPIIADPQTGAINIATKLMENLTGNED